MDNTLLGKRVIFKDGFKIKEEYLTLDERYQSGKFKKSPWQQVRFVGTIAGISTAGDAEESWPVIILKDCCLLENHAIAEDKEAINQPLRFCQLHCVMYSEADMAYYSSKASNGGLDIKDLKI